jgi:hypothetical protein
MYKIKLIVLLVVIASQHISLAQVIFQSSTLPIILINTNGQEIPDDPKIIGTLNIINNDTGQLNRITDSPNEFDLKVAIELRNQPNEWASNKASYSLELKDNLEVDTAVSLFGMGKEEDWVLHGPYADKSLIRNYLTFHLWNKTGRYGSDVQLCEVVINNDYKGVFVFMESIKRDDDRVDISKLNSDENTGDDLTGGYIFKIDKASTSSDVKSWTSSIPPQDAQDENQVITFRIEYPKPEDISTQQLTYITNYVNKFEQALAGSNYTNGDLGYRNYLDVSSFIDYSILTEMSRNVDGYRQDTYLYKDKDSKEGKLIIGPPWEFNFAFGNTDYCQGGDVQGWVMDFNSVCSSKDELNPFWWKRMMEDQSYVYSFKSRWQSLRNGAFQTSKILFTIDSLATILAVPQQRNFEKWPVLGTYIYPNNYVGSSYQDEIDYLKTWITERLAWMDTTIDLIEVTLDTKASSDQTISIYPNPSKKILNVSSQKQIIGYQILDQTGKILLKATIEEINTTVINFTDQSKGLYYIQLTFVDGSHQSRSFIKN